ncbi:hypothetical protein Taro_018989 [Colocasia esculenta]|uniref:Phosphoglycerate mutase-like protein AT74H n=1 Tax=Colocasia esculenta TaxID=4460 RepID=A0A843USI4_COLES|nr:hypothetical protein [Colocasia esculenta]
MRSTAKSHHRLVVPAGGCSPHHFGATTSGGSPPLAHSLLANFQTMPLPQRRHLSRPRRRPQITLPSLLHNTPTAPAGTEHQLAMAVALAAGAPRLPAMGPRAFRTRCCEDTLGMPRPKRPASDSSGLLSLFPEKSAIVGAPIPRPRRIVLVRHGQSEGNVDESVYTRVPDPRIGLTTKGWQEAEACGRRIREMILRDGADDWKVYFYVSPYKRTLETLRGIGRAFKHDRIAGVREEPRLREQDFGNFQDRERMRIEKAIRLRYGRFFYRFPNGESAADVYDRITGFRETLRADIDIGRFQPPGERTPNMNLVIVSHGLTLRVFLMRWYKWTVEQFEGLNNFGNGGTLVMQTGFGGRYSLLMHHSHEELREFGLTEEMLVDQECYNIDGDVIIMLNLRGSNRQQMYRKSQCSWNLVSVDHFQSISTAIANAEMNLCSFSLRDAMIILCGL